MDGAQEVARGLVVARGNGPILLEPGKEVLNDMACLVQSAITLARLLVGAARWDHHGLACFKQRLDDPVVGVVGLIGHDRLPLVLGQ